MLGHRAKLATQVSNVLFVLRGFPPWFFPLCSNKPSLWPLPYPLARSPSGPFSVGPPSLGRPTRATFSLHGRTSVSRQRAHSCFGLLWVAVANPLSGHCHSLGILGQAGGDSKGLLCPRAAGQEYRGEPADGGQGLCGHAQSGAGEVPHAPRQAPQPPEVGSPYTLIKGRFKQA